MSSAFTYSLMSIRILFFSALLASATMLSGQTIWLQPQKIKKQHFGWANILETDRQIYPSSQKSLINYNPALSTDDAAIRLPRRSTNLDQCQIFTIYKSSFSSGEGLIWSIKNDNSDALAMTDQRIADFTNGKFINFSNQDPHKAQLSSYHHHRLDFDGNVFQLGGELSDTDIPVEKFKGHLAELILFDKVLAPESRIRLESAFALKYSIPLLVQHDYLDANGEKIWDHSRHESYSSRIAGIGKSEVFHLNQKQSKTTFGNGHLALGIQDIYPDNAKNPSLLSDHSYLLWGDDDGSIEFIAQRAAPAKLNRNWKIVTQRYLDDKNLMIEIKHKGIQQELEANELLWIVLSSSETHNDNPQYEICTFDTEKNVFTARVEIKTEKDQYLSLVKAPKVWAQLNLTDYNCTLDQGGKLSIKPIGGNAPYHLQLTAPEQNYDQTFTLDDFEIAEVQNLKTGAYTFAIIDSKGAEWHTTFQLNTAEIPHPDLETKYILNQSTQIIDLSMYASSEYTLKWTLPDGKAHQGHTLELKQEGTYLLEVEKNGCSSAFPFEVFDTRNNIEAFTLNPNPTITGDIVLDARLKEGTEYTIAIHTSDGKTVSQSKYPTTKYIHQTLRVPTSGMYWITLRSGTSTMTKSLVAEITF